MKGRIADLPLIQKRILERVVRGKLNKEIAQELGLSESAVKSSLQHIFAKTGVRNRTALAFLYFGGGAEETDE